MFIRHQLEFFSVDDCEFNLVEGAIDIALERSRHCFGRVNNKYYSDSCGAVSFSPFHSGQYCSFLYCLSSVLSGQGQSGVADKVYLLNKMLNSCDIYHEVRLPDVFFMEHPVGSVMGRAEYGERFVFQQGCTVGGNKGVYPKIGSDVWMFANAVVIGSSQIGDRVFLSANCFVKDQVVPSDSIVFGSSPDLVIKRKEPDYFLNKSLFRDA